jgi:hypothetical protein
MLMMIFTVNILRKKIILDNGLIVNYTICIVNQFIFEITI